MRLTIDQAIFAQALQQASRIIAPQNINPALGNIQLDASSDGHLGLFSTDLTTQLRTTITADVDEPGRIIIPATVITELLRRIPTATVKVTTKDSKDSKDPNRIQIQYGKSKATLQTANDPPLPDFTPEDGATPGGMSPIAVPSTLFQQIHQEITYACSRNNMRGVICGVHLIVEPQRLTIQSTDGSRFAQMQIPLTAEGIVPMSIVVPLKTIQELARWTDHEPWQLIVSDRIIQVATPSATLSSRLLDGTYPELSHAIPPEYMTHAQISVNTLRSAIERVQIMTLKDHTSSIRYHQIPGEGIKLLSSSQTLGDAVETLECPVQGKEFQQLFSPQFLLEALRAVPSEEVQIELSGMNTAARIRGTDDPRRFHVLLPMRDLI